MNEHQTQDPLDRLIRTHPPAAPVPGLTERVMVRIADEATAAPGWQIVWAQRLAAAIGLALALAKLGAYALSAWIVVEIAG